MKMKMEDEELTTKTKTMNDGGSVLRSMTDDGGFRLIAARTDSMVTAAVTAQGVGGHGAALFSELLTGAVLFRETMAPTLRVQCILDGPVAGTRLVADAHPDGGTRGVASGMDDATLGDGWLLRMARQMPHGRLQEGVIAVPREGGLSAALMTYMQESEQVVSVVVVKTIETGEGLLRAGGYIVQLLPELEAGALAIMTERLTEFPGIDDLLLRDASVSELTDFVLRDMPYTRLEERPVMFACRCSRERVAAALGSAARGEVELALREERPLETRCDFCRTPYHFDLAQLAALLPGATKA